MISRPGRPAVAVAVALVVGIAAVIASRGGEGQLERSPDGEQVLDWNERAERAIVRDARQNPWEAALSLAIVQAAVHDALAIRRCRATGAAPLFGGRRCARVDIAQTARLALEATARPLAARLQLMRGAGTSFPAELAVVNAVLESLPQDAIAAPQPAGSMAVGDWRATPPLQAPGQGAWLAGIPPLVLNGDELPVSAAPRALTSRAYARDLDEVRTVGGARSAVRSREQTQIARFWSGNTVGDWNRAIRAIARSARLVSYQQARLLALANVAAANAAIACWRDKYRWARWRPITAIRQAAKDGNPRTTADPRWVPLLETPAFPEHPSGHGCLSGAFIGVARRLVGDEISFVLSVDGVSRRFSRLSDAGQEITDARVYAGAHFRFADTEGARLGDEVARRLVVKRARLAAATRRPQSETPGSTDRAARGADDSRRRCRHVSPVPTRHMPRCPVSPLVRAGRTDKFFALDSPITRR